MPGQGGNAEDGTGHAGLLGSPGNSGVSLQNQLASPSNAVPPVMAVLEHGPVNHFKDHLYAPAKGLRATLNPTRVTP